jgi:hypothetical protein
MSDPLPVHGGGDSRIHIVHGESDEDVCRTSNVRVFCVRDVFTLKYVASEIITVWYETCFPRTGCHC